MKIIISPAKKMEVCEDYTGVLTRPIFRKNKNSIRSPKKADLWRDEKTFKY